MDLSVLAISPSEHLVAIGGAGPPPTETASIRIWDMKAKKLLQELRGHQGAVSLLALNQQTRRLASTGDDFTLRLWDIDTGKELHQFKGHRGDVTGLAMDQDGKIMITGCADNFLRVWNLETRQETARLESHASGHLTVAIHKQLAVSGSGQDRGGDYAVRIWNVTTRRDIRRCEGHTQSITSVAFASTGRWALSGSKDGTARVWDVETGQELRRFEGHSGPVQRVGFLSTGTVAFTVSGQGVRLWDVNTGSLLATVKTDYVATCAAPYLNQNFLVTAGEKVLQQWDVRPLVSDQSALSPKITNELIRMDGGDRTIVALKQPSEPAVIRPGHELCILVREIFRQGLLLAAREELGLDTRDEVLGETIADGGKRVVMEFGLTWMPDKRMRIDIVERESELASKVVWSTEKSFPSDQSFDDFFRMAESLTRTEFPDGLRRVGFAAKALPKPAQARLPEEVSVGLGELTVTSQFAALRALHAALRQHGESPELLGGLVRGYANLGLLTETHWSPAHKVFKARALLYAQRLAVRDQQTAWPWWHRAYACALVGLHGQALAHLDKAKSATENQAAPDWVPIVEAYCRFQTGSLMSLSKGRQTRLAGLLRFLTLEHVVTSEELIAAGDEYLKSNPECYRVIDGLSALGGPIYSRIGSVRGLTTMKERMYQSLREIPRFPDEAGKWLDQAAADPSQGEPPLLLALRQAAADGEASWSMLADLVRQTRFVNTWRHVECIGYIYTRRDDDFMHECARLLGDHRHFPFFHSRHTFRDDPNYNEKHQQHKKWYAELRWSELDFSNHVRMLVFLQKHDPNRFSSQMRRMGNHHDTIYRDLLARFKNMKNAPVAAVHCLQEAAPYSPAARALMIRRGWDGAKKFVVEWEKDGHPLVLTALGEHYLGTGERAAAERVLERALRQGAPRESYLNLAKLYAAQGNEAKWLETLEESLKLKDPGPDHAQTRVHIAEHYMKAKNWHKAAPYAEAAAESGYEVALLCAHACQHALGNWDKAQAHIESVSRRYFKQGFEWYWWCKWTGYGNEDGARALADHYIERLNKKLNVEESGNIAMLHLVAGEYVQAQQHFQSVTAQVRDNRTYLYLALIADKTGNKKTRDDVFRLLQNQADAFGLLAKHIEQVMNQDGARLDVKLVSKILGEQSAETRLDVSVLAGMYCFHRGHYQEAIALLDGVGPPAGPAVRALAGTLLREARKK